MHQILATVLFSGALLIVCLGYLFCTRILGKPISASKHPIAVWVIDLVVWPVGIFALFSINTIIFQFAAIPGALDLLKQLRSLTLYLASFWLIARGVDLLLFRWYVFHRTGFTTPALLRGLSYIVFIVLALSLFLQSVGHPVTGFLVSTGLVAGIVGLALQTTLSDLISGIALSVDKPFHIGEWVQLENGTIGQVIDLTWRSTRIKTFSSTLLSIPNSKMAGAAINNLDRPEKLYAVWYKVNVSSDVDPKLVVTAISTAVGKCRGILQKPNPSVRLLDASGAPYVYSVWVHYASYLGHFQGQEQLYLSINESLKAVGVSPIGQLQEVRYARASLNNPMNPSIVDTLRSMDVFSDLEDAELEHIASASEYILVAENTVLLEENTHSTQLHVVVNGSLESSIEVNDGQRILAEQLSVGDSFGWATIVTGQKAIMTVKATADSLVLVIEAECLKPILHTHDELQQKFLALLTERVERLTSIRSDVQTKRKTLSAGEIRRRMERFISSN